MATVLKQGIVPDTTAALLFTAPGSTQIASFIVTNVTGSAVTLDLWTTSATDANRIIENESIPANSTVSLSKVVAMGVQNGEDIFALASAASALAVRVTGTA